MLHKLIAIASAEVGVREEGGNNRGERIREYQSATDLKPGAWPWCFDESVETLTISGWKKLSAIDKKDIVAQVDSDTRSVSFVNPIETIHVNKKIPIATIKTRSLSFKCDANHKFWGHWNTSKFNRHPELRPISDLTSSLAIPSVKNKNLDNEKFSFQDLDFLAAFIADGYFSRKERQHPKIRIQVSKERKIQELKKFKGQEHKSSKIYGSSKFPLTTFEFTIPDYFDSVFSDYKEIRWDWALSLSAKQSEYFIDRYVFWDGTTSTKVISTARKQNLDVFSAMSILCGKHPNVRQRKFENKKTCYEITTKNKNTRTFKKEHISIKEEEIDLYCIKVPSGIIICRDSSGTPFVTGNCAGYVDWCIREWLSIPQVVIWLNLQRRTPEEWRPKTALAYGLKSWALQRPSTTKVYNDTHKAQLGDIVTFDFSHVGFVVEDTGKEIVTLEGNALPLTSKVLTPHGFKLMKDIKVGDKVIDPDGEESFVTGVFPQGSRDLYKIKLQDKSEAISCDQHLWKIQIDGRKDKVLNTIDLKKRVNSKGLRSRIPQIQPVNFSFNDNLPIEPYLMGLLIGEGGMSSDYLGFTNIDDEIIDHVKNNLVSGHILKPHIENKNTVRGNYRIISESKCKNEMIRILKELNLQGKKSFEKFIPEIYKNSSIENRLSLLQGLMDSDGSVDKIGRCDFSSSSKQLSEDVMDLIRSLGGRCALNVKTNIFYTSPNQKTPKQARDCYRLQNINMPFFNPFRLKRKKERFKFRNAAWARRIVSVEPCGTGEVQCISVSAKSNLFITDNYIPTHNTNGKGDRDSTSGDGVWKKIRKKSLVKDLIRIHPSIASI